MGSQTETQWRGVLERDERNRQTPRVEYMGDPYRDEDWTPERESVEADLLWRRDTDAARGYPWTRVYLEKRTVTYGEPVRVELDEGSGDAG